MQKKTLTSLILLGVLTFSSSCESSFTFNVTRNDNNTIKTILANVSQSSSGISVRIPSLSSVPSEITESNDIEVLVDNSETSIPVTKNSDGSLSFPLSNGVKIDSSGKFNVIFIVDKEKSYLTTINTGPVLTLGNPAIKISSASQTIIQGEKINLEANIEATEAGKFNFNWFYTPNPSSGQYFPISGSGSKVSWVANTVGNFFIRLEMINKENGISSNYISPTPLLFVSDADNLIKTEPSSGNISKGSSVKLEATIPNISGNIDYNWSYAQSKMGPWQTITGSGQSNEWTPVTAGNFFIKVDVVNKDTNEVSSFISPEELVFVTESGNIFSTNPLAGKVNRGQFVTLTANVPNSDSNPEYNWFYSQSAVGPFIPMDNIDGNENKRTIKWRPSTKGTFYIKTDVVNVSKQTVLSFTSPNPLVFVTESTPLFTTEPEFARIIPKTDVKIKVNLDRSADNVFVWSFGPSMAGPWSAIGGTNGNEVIWEKDNKPTGSFYIKVEIRNTTDQTSVNFVSDKPLIFIDATEQDLNNANFG